jgi:hypothetical protein
MISPDLNSGVKVFQVNLSHARGLGFMVYMLRGWIQSVWKCPKLLSGWALYSVVNSIVAIWNPMEFENMIPGS